MVLAQAHVTDFPFCKVHSGLQVGTDAKDNSEYGVVLYCILREGPDSFTGPVCIKLFHKSPVCGNCGFSCPCVGDQKDIDETEEAELRSFKFKLLLEY